MNIKASTIDIPSDIYIQGSAKLEASEGSGLPTIEIIANTGRPMRLPNFPHPVVCELTGGSFDRDTTPIVVEHDLKRRVGHTTYQAPFTDKIVVKGVISCTGKDAEEVKNDAKNGFQFQASIGADVKSAYVVPAGKTVVVNGQSHQGPVIVATRFTVKELTLTTIGADDGTSVKIAARLMKESDMNYEEWLKSQGLNPASLTEDQTTKLKASWQESVDLKAKIKASDDVIPPKNDKSEEKKIKASATLTPEEEEEARLKTRRESDATEEVRVGAIRSSFSNPDYAEVDKLVINGKEYKPDEYRVKAIKDGDTSDSVELSLLRASRTRPTTFHGGHETLNPQNADFRAQTIECSLARSLGVPDSMQNPLTGKKYGLEHEYSEKVLEASAQKKNSYFYLSDLFALNIEAAGMSAAGVSRRSEEFIRMGLYANEQLRGGFINGQLQASGQFSTLAVSNILENVANKQLMAAFSDAEVIWSLIARSESVPDFKDQSYYRMTVDGGYVQIPPGGEIKHGEFRDDKQTLSVDTHGMMLGLDRRDMINDDLGAFNSIPDGLGRNAALALEFAVVAAMLDASYYASATNLITNDFGIAGISAAITKFRQRRDGKDKPILARPDRVIVGLQDAEEAEDIFSEKTMIATDYAGTASTTATNNNRHFKKYMPISSPIISETGILGMDGKVVSANVDTSQWFMMANPATHPALRVGFLKGRKRPVIESDKTSFNTLGMMWRSYFDFGTGEADDEYILKSSAGA